MAEQNKQPQDIKGIEHKDRIGLMFGSFNPPHLGHFEQARKNKQEHNLSEVWMMPVPVSAFKKGTLQAEFNQKVEMCEILARPHSAWLKAKPYCRDLGRDFSEQMKSYKRILENVSRENPDTDFGLVCGSDFERKVKVLKAVLSSAALLGGAIQKAAPIEIAFLSRIVSQVMAGKEIFEDTPVFANNRQGLVLSEQEGSEIIMPASSTDIREALEAGQPCPLTFPKELQDYVREKRLYGAAKHAP